MENGETFQVMELQENIRVAQIFSVLCKWILFSEKQFS